ncbi:MAG: hypothetical protein NC925_05060, partial [Candidatus Omnitrophica bacterium]|nr:hypothetical protein [Candidatus Omnitrophota bacterium]
MKKLVFFMAFLLFTATLNAYANPFLVEQPQKTEPKKEIKDNKKSPSEPPLPPPPPLENLPALSGGWKVIGLINDKVILERRGEEKIVPNGSIIDDCLVEYPEIICGKQKNETLKIKEFKTLQNKVSKLQDDIKNLKVELEKQTQENKNLKEQSNKEKLTFKEKEEKLIKEISQLQSEIQKIKSKEEQSLLNQELINLKR